MQPICSKQTALGVLAASRASPMLVGKALVRNVPWRGVSRTNSAAEATGGPAQRALLRTARATVHRLLDAADDLPNAAVEAYVNSGQRLPLEEVGEDNV